MIPLRLVSPIVFGISVVFSTACSGTSIDEGQASQAVSAPSPVEAYAKKSIEELSANQCSYAPSELFLESGLRDSVSWVNASSLLWLGWANLDVKKADKTGGEASLYQQWGFQVQSTLTTNEKGPLAIYGGTKYTLLRRDGALFLTFRHSNNAENWVKNVSYRTKAKPNEKATFALGATDIHGGFHDLLLETWPHILENLGRIDPDKKTPVYVAGHSLGAAEAHLASAGLAREGYNVVGVYLTGAPRVSGEEWATRAGDLPLQSTSEGRKWTLKDVTFRIHSGLDPVSHVPLSEEARPLMDDLAKAVTLSWVDNNPIFSALSRRFYKGMVSVLKTAVGGEFVDFETYGKGYDFDAEGRYLGSTPTHQGGEENVRYWQGILNHLQDSSKFKDGAARAVGLAKTLGYHFVRNPTGYGCVLMRKVGSDAGVATQSLTFSETDRDP